MPTRNSDWIDPHLYRWLSRGASIRDLEKELKISRTKLHTLLMKRAAELDVNATAGRGDGLWAVISQEYLDPAKLAKMRERDRLEIEEWTRANFEKILGSQASRVYTIAECRNRTRRDVVGKEDLAIMENDGASIGKWFGAKIADIEIPECLPIKIRRLNIPIPKPIKPIQKRVAAPMIAPILRRTIAPSSPVPIHYATSNQPSTPPTTRTIYFQQPQLAAVA
jgi:hypothetical protein